MCTPFLVHRGAWEGTNLLTGASFVANGHNLGQRNGNPRYIPLVALCPSHVRPITFTESEPISRIIDTVGVGFPSWLTSHGHWSVPITWHFTSLLFYFAIWHENPSRRRDFFRARLTAAREGRIADILCPFDEHDDPPLAASVGSILDAASLRSIQPTALVLLWVCYRESDRAVSTTSGAAHRQRDCHALPR